MHETITYEGSAYDEKYSMLHSDFTGCSDADLIDWIKYFNRFLKEKNDYFYICINVCEDILRERWECIYG